VTACVYVAESEGHVIGFVSAICWQNPSMVIMPNSVLFIFVRNGSAPLVVAAAKGRPYIASGIALICWSG
jgi:hypothetical protein